MCEAYNLSFAFLCSPRVWQGYVSRPNITYSSTNLLVIAQSRALAHDLDGH